MGLYCRMGDGNPAVESQCGTVCHTIRHGRSGSHHRRDIFKDDLPPSWLCGWAIGLTIMGSMKVNEIGTLPIQIGVAMLVGVIYVGVGVDAFQGMLVRRLARGGAAGNAAGQTGGADGRREEALEK